MRGMQLQIYAQVLANLSGTAYGENPLYEMSGMRKTKLAEKSPEIRKK
jgi:hypothetical protein